MSDNCFISCFRGKQVNVEVVNKLEERRNKFKRKRKNKKAEEESNKLREQLLGINSNSTIQVSNQSLITPEQQIPEIQECCNDNTTKVMNETFAEMQHKEITQIPGWNDIQCLFEQVDEKQLPDKNNLLAILKVCAYGRMKFLQEKKLPLNTPYNSFKEEYLNYRKTFFEEAAKRWENITLDTFEDLHKVLMYLSQKERTQPKALSDLVSYSTIHASCHLSNTSTANTAQRSPSAMNNVNLDPVDQYFEHSDDDSLFELSFVCDENNKSDKSDLFVHLDKLSSDIVNNKLRQDSGFYDFNSDESSQSDVLNRTCDALTPNLIDNTTDINSSFRSEFVKDSIAMNYQTANLCLDEIDLPVGEVDSLVEHLFLHNPNLDENKENQQPQENSSQAAISDFDVSSNLSDHDCNRSIISDHDYCSVPLNVQPLRERPIKRKTTEYHKLKQNSNEDCCGCRISSNVDKTKSLKQRKIITNDTEVSSNGIFIYFSF